MFTDADEYYRTNDIDDAVVHDPAHDKLPKWVRIILFLALAAVVTLIIQIISGK